METIKQLIVQIKNERDQIKLNHETNNEKKGTKMLRLAEMLQAHPEAKNDAEATELAENLRFQATFLGAKEVQDYYNDRLLREKKEAAKFENMGNPYWKEGQQQEKGEKEGLLKAWESAFDPENMKREQLKKFHNPTH